MSEPAFPPLVTARHITADPFRAAVDAAADDAEPGRLWWRGDDTALEAALELAPEMPLADAIGVVFAAGLGLADAVGALGPPELGLFFRWPGEVRANGATCGHLAAAASTRDGAAEPDWLVVGFALSLAARTNAEPGLAPQETSLAEEGCVLPPDELVAAFARHALSWIYRFTSEGFGPVGAAYTTKLEGVGETVAAPRPGVFLGLDERGGMVLREAEARTILPLTDILEDGWRPLLG